MRDYLEDIVPNNVTKERMESLNALSYLEGVDKMMHVTDGDKQICLCHYPIAEWNGYFRGSWHIYGHIHANINDANKYMLTKERALNAGCMINNYTPASFNELVRNNEAFKARMV